MKATHVCFVDECDRTATRRAMCTRHYKRWRRYGDPTKGYVRKPATERFWIKVNKQGPMPAQGVAPGACWEWTGAKTPGGYGQFRPDYHVSVVSHRFAYEELVGEIPDGLQLDHLCRNRACVNPKHLEPVTQLENIRRGFSVATLNRLKTHCPRKHPYSVDNTYIHPRNGGRICRQCARDRNRRAYAARKAAA